MTVKTCVSRAEDHRSSPERTRIFSVSLTIRKSSDLKPTSHDTSLGKRRNENRSRSTLPVLHKTGRKQRLTPNRIYIWCFCDDKRVRHEERMAPKCIWYCWCHMTHLSVASARISLVEVAAGISNVLAHIIERLSRRCLSLSDRDSPLGC
jgi:hypothetical protein